ncbi:MAG: multidrug efflux SMR transporter [Pseudomonadota bacterium]
MHWIYLSIAIVAEVIGSAALKSSAGFTRPGATLLALGAFLTALFFLSLSLRVLPLGIAYAIWAGAGTVLVAGMSVLVLRQSLDTPAICGIALIVAGVVMINTLSKVTPQ